MDLNDLWQEHKRFFLALAIGLVLFFVAHGLIAARFDPAGLERAIAASRSDLARPGRYGEKALRALRDRAREFSTRLERDRKLVLFSPRPAFDVSQDQYPERRYGALAADTRRGLQELLELENVRVDARRGADQLGLPRTQPVERDAVQRTLIGLDLADRALRLWVQAGHQARVGDRRALGLIALEQVAIDAPPAPAQGRPGGAAGPTLDAIGARIRITCGSRTVEHFLRLVQASETPLQVEMFQAQLSSGGGDALDVDMKLVATQLLEGA